MAAKSSGSGPSQPDKSKPQRSGWRGKASAAPAAPQHGWQESQGTRYKREVARKNLRHRLKLAGAATMALTLLGLLVHFLIRRHGTTTLIAMAMTNYDAPLPPNAWALEDVELFAAYAPSSTDKNLKVVTITSDDVLRNLDEQVRQNTPQGLGQKKCLLIYLSAHGAVNDQGEPCLILPPPSEPGEVSVPLYLDVPHWTRIKDIVERVDKAAPGVKKLILLDASRSRLYWSSGLLYNAFAERLADALDSQKHPDVAILSSAGPGQLGWTAPGLRASAFGWFVLKGLHGEASDANEDEIVDLQELHRFLQTAMSNWVVSSRRDVQRPLLVPADANFELVWTDPRHPFAKALPGQTPAAAPANETAETDNAQKMTKASNGAEPAPASTFEEEPLGALFALWQKHQELQEQFAGASASGRFHGQALEWERFQQSLLRCEQLLLGGKAYRDEALRLLVELNDLAEKLRSGSGNNLPAHSLPLALAARGSAEAVRGELKACRQRLDALLSGAAKPEAADELLKGVNPNPTVRAAAAWDWLRERPPAEVRGGIQRIFDLIGRDVPAELVEFQFLRLLNAEGELPDQVWSDGAQHVLAALQCRHTAERAAAPSDVRAGYAARAWLMGGDEQRRAAEDRLFLGTSEALSEAMTLRQAAVAGYEKAIQAADTAGEALHARDRAWAELPYLAEWLTHRAAFSCLEVGDERASLAETEAHAVAWLEAVRLAHKLDAGLNRFLRWATDAETFDEASRLSSERDLEAIHADANALSEHLRVLHAAYFDRATTVATREVVDAANLRNAVEVLSVPLISGDTRRKLLENYSNRTELDRDAPASTAQGAASDVSPPGERPDVVTTLNGLWSQSPLVSLLELADEPAHDEETRGGTTDVLRRLVRDAVRVRQRLQQLDAGNVEMAATADEELDKSGEGVQLGRRAHWQSAAAALLFKPEKDAVEELWQFDQHHALVGQASRTLSDFWGSDGVQNQGEPYFIRPAQSCLEAARGLHRSEAWQRQEARFHALEAVVATQSVVALDSVGGKGQDERHFTERFKLRAPESLPPGTAALAAFDSDDHPAALRPDASKKFAARLPLTLPSPEQDPASAAGANLSVEFEGAVGEQPWRLLYLYRGHRKTFALLPRSARPPRVVTTVPASRPPEALVSGHKQEAGAVVFILDCSGSMDRFDFPGKMRMDVARGSLLQILEELAEPGLFRAGMWLYGHRYDRTPNNQLDWNNAWNPPQPGVLSNNDVQNVVPLRLLNNGTLGTFTDLLRDRQKVKPWGWTPLYYSMMEAIAHGFVDAPPDRPHLLVVITDGQDHVDPAQGGNTYPRVANVARAIAGDPTLRMWVLNCGSERLPDDVVKLTEESKGGYVEANKQEKLLSALRQATGLYEYEICEWTPDGGGRNCRNERLGEPFTGPSLTAPKRYLARLVTQKPDAPRANFALENGQRVHLLVKHANGRPRLVQERFSWLGEADDRMEAIPNPAGDTADEDFNPASFYVEAHSMLGDEGAVKFALSVQNGNEERFSPRPAEIWVEIKPVFAGAAPAQPGDDAAYVFLNPQYDELISAPVLRCTAPAWPAAAKAADIRLAWKLTHSSESFDREARVVDVRDVGPADQADAGQQDERRAARKLDLVVQNQPVWFNVRVNDAPSGQGVQVLVTEYHPPRTADTPAVRVELSPAADRVERRYYPPQDGRVVHVFSYEHYSENEALTSSVRVTSRDTWERGAIQLPRPLRVQVATP